LKRRLGVAKTGAKSENDDAWMAEPVKTFRANILAHYEGEQAELEAHGRWWDADFLNAWLSGHWMTWRDMQEGRWPIQRTEFLRRMRGARIGRNKAS